MLGPGQVRPYIGDDEGRSGLCSDQSLLGSGTFADLFGCADLCHGLSGSDIMSADRFAKGTTDEETTKYSED